MKNPGFNAVKSLAALGAALLLVPALAAELAPMSVRDLMQNVITPTTATLWGAYEIKTDAQWQELETAANGVIAAGEALLAGGTGPKDAANAANPDWQEYTRQLIAAGRSALAAIRERNEAALSDAGNDELYPPCESCHGRYMTQ